MKRIYILLFILITGRSQAQPAIDSIIMKFDSTSYDCHWNDSDHGGSSSGSSSGRGAINIIFYLNFIRISNDTTFYKVFGGNRGVGQLSFKLDSLTNVITSLHSMTGTSDGENYDFTTLDISKIHLSRVSNGVEGLLTGYHVATMSQFHHSGGYSHNSCDYSPGTTSESDNHLTFFGSMPLEVGDGKASSISDAEFLCFPNPASSIINISSNEITDNNGFVFDLLGRAVATFTSMSGSQTTRIDISSLVNGVYWIKVGNKIKQIVVSH